ncbi:helix-turn-helix domain-containing protein [Vibrio harveyi]|uniref:helix-turn-helix domain-containing protein n=2 Tax=Vibrio harveyi TaxID=669 RepID=UPI0024812EBB|nr:helix-turn-helix domain-containing protein [Vibrio harveyi]
MLITSPKQLAIHLRDERKSRNLSQNKVADPVGIKQDTVSKFELNPETTRIQTLFRILSSLNLEMHIVPKSESIDPRSDDESDYESEEKW